MNLDGFHQYGQKKMPLFEVIGNFNLRLEETWGTFWKEIVCLDFFYLVLLTHYSGRVTQICVFNTVKLGTSASSP